ncbi:hypothetical protein [Bradyrhizobium sp. USDA 4473]
MRDTIKLPSGMHLRNGQLHVPAAVVGEKSHNAGPINPRLGGKPKLLPPEIPAVIGHRSRTKAHRSGVSHPLDDEPLQQKNIFREGAAPKTHPGMVSRSQHLRGKPGDAQAELERASSLGKSGQPLNDIARRSL